MQQMLLGWYEARTFFSVLLDPQTKRVLLTRKSNSPLTFAHWIKEKLFYIQMEESLTHKPNTPDRFNRWRGLSFKDTILSLYFSLCPIVCETLFKYFSYVFLMSILLQHFHHLQFPIYILRSGSLLLIFCVRVCCGNICILYFFFFFPFLIALINIFTAYKAVLQKLYPVPYIFKGSCMVTKTGSVITCTYAIAYTQKLHVTCGNPTDCLSVRLGFDSLWVRSRAYHLNII